MTVIYLYFIFFRHKLRIECKRILYLRTVMSWSRKSTFLGSRGLNAKYKCYSLAIWVLHARHWKYVLSSFLVFPRKLEEYIFFFLKNIMNYPVNYSSTGRKQFVETEDFVWESPELKETIQDRIWRGNKPRG